MLESKLDSLDVAGPNQHTFIKSEYVGDTERSGCSRGTGEIGPRLKPKLDTLDTSQESQTGLQAKLETLEANLTTIQDMIPSSQRASEIVEKLLNNGNILKNVVSNQSQQIDVQTARIQQLEQEFIRLRNHSDGYA